MAGRARCHFFVARLIQQRGQPADFQFRAAFDQHIGVIELHDEAWLGVHEMRVFRRLGQRGEFNFVAADFFGDGPEVRRGGDDV